MGYKEDKELWMLATDSLAKAKKSHPLPGGF